MFGESRYKPRSGSHQGMFEKQRARQRHWEQSVTDIANTDKVIAYANWERKTAATIDARTSKQRLVQLQKQDDERLADRRRRLADLYNREMDDWEDEIRNSVETMDERKQRILEKATKLRNAREEARRNYVQDCYNRQWRDACDDTRTLDSQAMVQHVTQQRWEQVAQKATRKEEEAAREGQYMEKIYERMRFLEGQEEAALRKRQDRDAHMKRDLDVQVAYNADRRTQLAHRTSEEDRQELEELRRVVRAEEERMENRRQEAHARGREVREFNERLQVQRREKAEEEQQRDLMLLKYNIEKDKAGEEAEKQKREEEKQMIRQTHAYLQEQMIKEKADEAAYDAIRLQAENRIWDEREANLKAQRDARERLMAQVHAGRQEQMRLRRIREEEEGREEAQLARAEREEFMAEEERQRKTEMEKRQALLDGAAKLRQQMEETKSREAREKQEEYLRVKQMEAYERKHHQRLAEQAGVVITHRPLKHTQWYT